MSQIFLVYREQGAGWDPARKVNKQDDWDAHAALMNRLHEEGFILLGGPIEGGDKFQVLIVVRADSEADVRTRFAGDTWIAKDITRIARIAPWHLLLGTLP